MKTRAAILVEQRKPLVVDEVEIPRLRYGQVLVRLLASRICGSQLGEIAGVKGPDRFLPHLLGHEGAGVVLEVGPEVSCVKPEDHVVLHWKEGAGIQARPPIYGWKGSSANAGWVTTFNDMAVVSENRLTVVAPETSPEIRCLLADTLTTGFGVINNDAKLSIGESVVIIGCGGIGLGVVLGAKLAGAYPIIAVDLFDHKLAVAKKYGATHCVNAKEVDFGPACEEILHGKADVVIDGVGRPSSLEVGYALAGPQGRIVIFGVMDHQHKVAINTLPLHFGKRLVGSHGGASQPARDIPRYLRMMRAGAFDPHGFISHRITLDQVNQGIDQMRAGHVVHCLIEF